jgi:hypothetical protein
MYSYNVLLVVDLRIQEYPSVKGTGLLQYTTRDDDDDDY